MQQLKAPIPRTRPRLPALKKPASVPVSLKSPPQMILIDLTKKMKMSRIFQKMSNLSSHKKPFFFEKLQYYTIVIKLIFVVSLRHHEFL